MENSLKEGAKKTVSKKLSDPGQVDDYMNKLNPAVKEEIDAVRKIIKAANAKLNERINWNAPSYYYQQDILTFGPYKAHKLLLVFHHPAVVTIKSKILEGDYKDRRLVYFKSKTDAEVHKEELARIINGIIRAIDKQL